MRRQEFCHLYVMGLPSGPLKIGVTGNLDARLALLKKEKPDLHIVKSYRIPQRLSLAAERYAHWKLRDKHFRHEWFNCTSEEAVAVADEATSFDYGKMDLIPTVHPRGKKPMLSEVFCKEIDTVLKTNEDRTEFVREAVEREIKRRQKGKRK